MRAAYIVDLVRTPVGKCGGALALVRPDDLAAFSITTTLLYERWRRPDARYGLTTMCVGVRQGAAVIYEKC